MRRVSCTAPDCGLARRRAVQETPVCQECGARLDRHEQIEKAVTGPTENTARRTTRGRRD